jgi:RNA polymerase sigma factor (sigma-70 family)
MTKSDIIVIKDVLQGDTNAYSVLVDRYKDKVFSLVFGILRDHELAQEVAQDVFVKAYTSLKKFRMDSSFSTWIYRISYNTAISETRKRKQLQTSFDDKILSELSRDNEYELLESFDKEKDQHQLSKAISSLQPDEQLIINMYYFEDKAISDISEITGLGQSNIKVKLHRLRKKLKELLIEINKSELAFL